MTRVLIVDDDEKILCLMEESIKETFPEITLKTSTSFEEGKEIIENEELDLIILDIYEGLPGNSEASGKILMEQVIQQSHFIPVIFFSALVEEVREKESEVIRIVQKRAGNLENLINEIRVMLDSPITGTRTHLKAFINETLLKHYWDVVHILKDDIKEFDQKHTTEYLLIKRLSMALVSDLNKKLQRIQGLNEEKVNPLMYYVYPPKDSIECDYGDIFENSGKIFVLVTPSCDLQLDSSDSRRADFATLLECTDFSEIQGRDRRRDTIQGKIHRYFFLPKTPFIESMVVDFQKIHSESFESLSKFRKIVSISNPFSEELKQKFSSYYSRIGIPEIDDDIFI